MTSTDPTRVLAIDWSGAKAGERKKIWLAEVVDGQMVRLESGRNRDEIIAHLVSEASAGRPMVVGIDFAFSFPQWFCHELGAADGPALWKAVAQLGEQWLADCPHPFWGRPAKKRPTLPAHFRKTEDHAAAHSNSQPKSVFQIGGGGAVGTGSIRGMPHLETLCSGGFSIWPFQRPALPMVLEIYPRTLTGPVVKSDQMARSHFLTGRFPEMTASQRTTAASSEDAFDAAVSAMIMAHHLDEILALESVDDAVTRLEGTIWNPAGGIATDTDRTAAEGARDTGVHSDCPFCVQESDRIIDGSLHGVAVPDRFPVSRGHTLVVPRDHVGSIFDLPGEVQQDLWALVAGTRRLLKERHQPVAFTIGVNDGRAAGQTVAHAHIHIIPRYEGDVPDPRGGIRWVIPSTAEYWES